MLFHYTVRTGKSVDEAIADLERHLKDNRFGILWQMDMPAKLREKGADGFATPYRILEVCNPQEAARVLERNEKAGYFLPCKIVVYESKGRTHIGLPRPTALVSMLEDAELLGMARKIEDTLVQVLDLTK